MELLIVVVILGIIGGITVTALVQGFQAQAAAQERVDVIEEGHRSLARISREIRSACDIDLSPTTADVRVGDRGAAGDVERFVIEVDGGDVVIDQSVIDSAGNVSGERSSVVATDVTSATLFEALQADGAVVPINSGLYARDLIAEVAITLAIDAPNNSDVITLNTSVNLRNQGTFSC